MIVNEGGRLCDKGIRAKVLKREERVLTVQRDNGLIYNISVGLTSPLLFKY